MNVRWRFAMSGRLALAVLALVVLAPGPALAVPDGAGARGKLVGMRLPFIENRGQVDGQVAYYAPTFAGTLFVTRQGELVYALRRAGDGPGWALTETLVGGTVRPVGTDRSASGVSHFIGDDRARWRSDVPSFGGVSLGEVWPGVTVALRAGGRTVEKVFTVAPGASVDRIRLRVDGAQTLSVDAAGALVAGTGLGAVTFTTPVAYQERDGVRRAVTVAYRLGVPDYGFTVGAYDPGLPLVIDPLLRSTYLGGAFDEIAFGLAIHPVTGAVYVAGNTSSTDFPGTAGGAQPNNVGGAQAFVARLSSDLATLAQATYLGGAGIDTGSGVAVHPTTGDVYVTGTTSSTNFPGTGGGAQPVYGGGDSDVFVARLSGDLTALLQATYLGGSDTEFSIRGPGVAIHPTSGEVYVVSSTFSTNFPGTAGGAQPVHGGFIDAFVARLNSALTVLVQATYLGGDFADHGLAVAFHPTTGDAYVTGTTSSFDFPGTAGGAQPAPGGSIDGFVARLNSGLTTLFQSTYLGGVFIDEAFAIGVHPITGDVYAAGVTFSGDFPGTTEGAQRHPGSAFGQDAFVVRLNGALTVLVRATFLGGAGTDQAFALVFHPVTGDVYVGGFTASDDFPGTAGGVQPGRSGGPSAINGFIARLPQSLTAIGQATYLGGTGGTDLVFALAINPITGDVYAAGDTNSTDFPGTAGGAQPAKAGASFTTDAFVTRLTRGLALVDPPPGPDLTVTKSHARNFLGAAYSIIVTNVGTAPTVGTVTMTDTLPASLTAIELGGFGWTCTLATVTCTRADALAPGSNYPVIVLVVDVAGDAPAAVTNTATVSGGGDVFPGNDSVDDLTVINVFGDVPATSPFLPWINALARSGLTGGCTPVAYCPDAPVTREAMAVFLVRGVHGAEFVPPAATGTAFVDVPASDPFAKWIEQLARDGITGGCATSPPRYCPDDPVTRGSMAVLLLRARHGAGYVPPAATGTVFSDVPASHPFAAFIEQLALEGITGGCGPNIYCPEALATRAETAVFLVRAFDLPM